jgi:hypothetical protein
MVSPEAKVGRNQLCPCGLGKKFKHCCGRLTPPPLRPAPAELHAAIRRARDDQQARELLRAKQQGHGRPIISQELHGYRLVAIGAQITWSKRWVYFTDFLLDYLKDQLGRAWAEQQSKTGSAHPVFRWLERLQQAQRAEPVEPGGTHVTEEVGWVTGLFGLGYALYLIAHHDQLAASLLVRLRAEVSFRAAAYETLVASAFAKAGYAISWAELGATDKPTPEFWASAKSGARFAVEAKCKDVWKTTPRPKDQAFVDELRQWVRNQLYRASKKKLDNPIYWFELSIDVVFSADEWRTVREIIVKAINEAETLTVAGTPAAPAYVFVTNNIQLVNDDAVGSPLMALLEGFRIPDLKSNILLPFDAAMEARDRHRDVAWVFECLQEIQRIPMTFDGHPSELLGANGEALASFKIGQPLEITNEDGQRCSGIVEDVCSMGDRVFVYLLDSGVRQAAIVPLSPQEIAAVAVHGDAIFGKPEGPHRNLEGDPLALYDWFLKTYSSFPRASLLRRMSQNHPGQSFDGLTTQELATRLARGDATAALRSQTARGREPVSK